MIRLSRERLMVIATWGRLALVPGFILSFHGWFWSSMAWLAAIVLADHFDGVIARWLGADGPARRIADVAVDQLTIWPSLVAIFVINPQYRNFWILFSGSVIVLGRILYATCGILAYRRYRVLLRGKFLHKEVGLGLAFLAIVLIHGASLDAAMNAVGVAGILSWTMGFDFWMRYRYEIRKQFAGNQHLVIAETEGRPLFPLKITFAADTSPLDD
jgi:phosphatidylglycerophosphate synthase